VNDWRVVPGLIDFGEGTVLAGSFEEIEPGLFKRVFRLVPVEAVFDAHGTYSHERATEWVRRNPGPPLTRHL
jgi:hypothetical protein